MDFSLLIAPAKNQPKDVLFLLALMYLRQSFQLVWYWGCSFFYQLFTSYRLFYLTKRFQTLICRFKGLYYVVLLSSHCAPCLLEPLKLFCFLHSDFFTAFLPYILASQWVVTLVRFSRHWFNCAMMFGSVNLLSRKLVTLIKLSSAPTVSFGLRTI